MTIKNPPIFLQSAAHPAEDVRRMITALTGSRQGVFNSGDMLVTQSDSPAMSVKVAGGMAIVSGNTTPATQGSYFVENRGSSTVTIDTADASNPRRDIVILRLRDSVYSGADNDAVLQVVKGTPAASPVDPTITGSYVSLARVTVGAAVSSIVTANITDLRIAGIPANQKGLVVAHGGLIVCSTTSRPTETYQGMKIYDTTLKRELVYSASEGWVYTAPVQIGSSFIDTNIPATTGYSLISNQDGALGNAPCAGTLSTILVGSLGHDGSASAGRIALTANGEDTGFVSDTSTSRAYVAAANQWTAVSVTRNQLFAAGSPMGYRVYGLSSVGSGNLFLEATIRNVFFPSA